jgi:hypothetical protein
MKLGSHMDYHGSRAYAPDPDSAIAGSWVKRLAGPLAAWTKHMLEMLFKPGAREAAETVWLVRGDERHFSVLGSDSGRKLRRAVAPCPFPEDEIRVRRPIGYRVDGE